MMKRFFQIVFLVFAFYSCTQKKSNLPADSYRFDSLLKVVEGQTKDTDIRVSLLNAEKSIDVKKDTNSSAKLFKVANRFYNNNLLNDYKRVVFKINQIARKHKDTLSIARSYQYLGDYYYNTIYPDSSLLYYIQAEKFARTTNNSQLLQDCYLSMARIKTKVNDMVGSELLITQALSIKIEDNNPSTLYDAYNILGFISNEQHDYENAITAHKKALDIAETNGFDKFPFPIEASLNNIGNVYQNLNDNKTAKEYFQKALSKKDLKINHPELYALLLENLGYSLYKLGQFTKPINLIEESIVYNDSMSNTSSAIYGRIRLAEIYLDRDSSKAYQTAQEAYTISETSQNPYDKLIALKTLVKHFPDKNANYNTAYIHYSDSLHQNERKIKDKFARIQFETEEIERQKVRLEVQNRNLMLFFFVTIMMVLLLFVIRTQRAKNRELLLIQAQQKANEEIYSLMISQQNKLEEGRIKEKKRIAQELHDGVLSRLFGARLNLDSLNRIDGDEAIKQRMNHLNELRNIEQDIREISHDLNREKFILINNFIAILNNLFEEQAESFSPDLVTHIDTDIEWDKVSNSVKINAYRIVQEAFQNINKYAKADEIQVRMIQIKNYLHLTIIDNGIGFDFDKKSKGIGLQNMTSRAQECNGNITIKSKPGKGTSIEVQMPLLEEKQPENTENTTIEDTL